ncbi:MAG: hypothetical protein AB7N91_07075 [Candidatus Tectimicrobiota bacterium]
MTLIQLEQRMAALEAEVAQLKSKFELRDSSTPWWEQIAGTFQSDPVYDQAMRLGRHYRQSLRHKLTTRNLK